MISGLPAAQRLGWQFHLSKRLCPVLLLANPMTARWKALLGEALQEGDGIENQQLRKPILERRSIGNGSIHQVEQVLVARHQVLGLRGDSQVEVRLVFGIA